MQNVALRLAGSASARRALRQVRPSVLSRSIHRRSGPGYLDKIPNGGLGDFMSPAALRTIAVDYQEGLLDRLNDLVRGTPFEQKTVAQTVIEAATSSQNVLVYNYASEALNTSFFLSSLAPPAPDTPALSNEWHISPALNQSISRNFGSLEELKSRFGATAMGIFNSGWVWLVCDAAGSLAVLPTFNTETLLVRSRQLTTSDHTYKAQASVPPPPQGHVQPSQPTPTTYYAPRPVSPSGRSALMEDYSYEASSMSSPSRMNRGVGDTVYPLMCLSVHERTWMSAGYGVWGKEEYLRRAWSVVNWNAISEAYEKFQPRLRV
ncbi:hypothetical protein EIP91_003222 [Steccherinum ochraceum]|uniref:Manganese/iron superoxide dismutase C-terminal domain-containing protein n=1 Tax=Steccherinum ochraceum TaxID=92696 RepID=A0A4R0RP56_9APHY|nr:hypothetical protein EIP91_003222 [Steccherinum ochraceum]